MLPSGGEAQAAPLVKKKLIKKEAERPATAQPSATKPAAKSAVVDAAASPKPTLPQPGPGGKIQLAILLDTSNSMDGLINQARTQLWKIVSDLATAKHHGKSPRLEVALYEYGNNALDRESGYIRRVSHLSEDLDKLSEQLFSLKTNGGNEYCGWVIQVATQELKWSESDKDLKIIFIAGNEPFTQGKVDFKQACRAALKQGITINTIFCGRRAEGVSTGWEEGAKLSDGSFTSIDQDRAVATVKTPYDAKLQELSAKINQTYVAYGAAEKRQGFYTRQLNADRAASRSAPAAAAARATVKGSNLYRATESDLVDAIAAGKANLKTIRNEDLPAEVRKLDEKGRAEYIAKKAAERKQIQAEIGKLSSQRATYLAEQERKNAAKGNQPETFDSAVYKILRKQAQDKGFEFSNPKK